MFNTKLGRLQYTVMSFGAAVGGDVFKRKFDECFGKLKQVIIITDGIMVDGYKPDHSDHDQAFTSLLQTAHKCNVKLNYDKLQYKQNEVDFFGDTYTTNGHKPAKSRVSAITAMPSPTKKTNPVIYWHDKLFCPRFHQDCQSLQNHLENWQRTKYLLIVDLNIRKPSQR